MFDLMLIRIKDSIKVLFGIAAAVPIKPRKSNITDTEKVFFCPICQKNHSGFQRISDRYETMLDEVGYIHPYFQMETLNRLFYTCPVCGASDRERFYAMYLTKTKVLRNSDSFKLLDIAPAKPLKGFIRKTYPEMSYRSADLYMEGVDDKVDVTNMDIYEENSFDFIICSHVLEHIEKDLLAMKELYRVLKPGAKAIIMAPILLSLEADYENPDAQTPDERWKHFGQDDHVRMYSKNGFINKLKTIGFKVVQYEVNYFGIEEFHAKGIHKRSVLYLAEKPFNKK